MRTVYSYAVQWVHHGKTRTESYGTSKELAERMKARKEDKIEQGILHDVIPISFEDFTEEHLSSVELSVSAAYYNDQERVLRQFKDCCDPQPMADINAITV